MNTVGTLRLVLLVILVALSSAARQAPSGAKQTSAARSDHGQSQKTDPPIEDSYVIGPDDVLDISVWREPELTRTVPVRPDGKISLPLLNDVPAAGLTPMQLAAAITVALRRYVNQPQVTVILKTINSRRVYVLGEVNRPGPIALLPNMTVLQALSSAGGLTQFANQKQISVVRTEDGKENRYPFNYKQAVRGEAANQNIILQPGDTIIVP